jgi:LacI family transcriptional regulator
VRKTTVSQATLTDVAKAAGVSVATASMVLNPSSKSGRVGAERSERVRAAAAKLGYVPNYHARAMQAGRAETLGFALDYGQAGTTSHDEPMGGEYFHHLTMGIEVRTHFVGYNLALIGPGVSERAIDRGVRQLQQRRLDALIVPAVLRSASLTQLVQRPLELPIVLVEHDGPSTMPVVHYDEAEGVRRAVRHLAELGHRHLLWLGPQQDGHTRTREDLFDAALREFDLAGDSCRFIVPEPRYRRTSIIDAATVALGQRLRSPRSFTGVVCYNDFTAVGAYAALLSAGVVIPQQVSVIGFDDFTAAYLHPRLTTISHMLVEMGQRAAELALELVGGSGALARLRGHREVLVPQLVERASTAPVAR